MKLAHLTFLAAIAALLPGCLDMSMPDGRSNAVSGRLPCPAQHTRLETDKCPETGECVTLDDGTLCVKIKMADGGDGPNCNGGYITVTSSQRAKCQDGFTGDAYDWDWVENDDAYPCVSGKIEGRYCRLVPPEYAGSQLVVQEGQRCTVEQLSPQAGSLRVHFMDVGQGDAIWVQTPDGKNVLIDSGDGGYFSKTAAAPIIADYLAFHGFPKGSVFDTVILSHPDSDHSGGMSALFGTYGYNLVQYVDPLPKDSKLGSPSYGDWVKKVVSKVEASELYMPASDFFANNPIMPFFGADVVAEYLTSDPSSSDTNNASLVFKLTYAGRSILFTGDAEKEVESFLVNAMPEKLASNFLKVGHHGSDSSSTAAFIKAVWPDSIPQKDRLGFIMSGRILFKGTTLPRDSTLATLLQYIPTDQLFSTNAGDGLKSEQETYRDDNILLVIQPDGGYYACYSGTN